MATEAPKPRIEIRRATPADLPTVTALLSERDGLELDPAAVAHELQGLDPEHYVAWLAFVDDVPAAMNSFFLRTIRSDGPEPRELRTGYWANLYVGEPWRKLMIYPQLVFAMIKGMRELELDMLLGGIRQPDVAEGHQKLGYRLFGELPVLMRPLRPFRLVARQKRLGAVLETVAPLSDLGWGGWLALRRRAAPAGVAIENVSLEDERIDELVALMQTRASGRVAQCWDAAAFRRRFTRAIDGERYVLQIASRDGTVVGGVIHRLAWRGHGVRTGVVLDLVLAPGEEAVGAALLSAAEDRMRRDDADIVLLLDGIDADFSTLARARGYRASGEVYYMMANPGTVVAPDSWDDDIRNWLFTFSDHDAF